MCFRKNRISLNKELNEKSKKDLLKVRDTANENSLYLLGKDLDNVYKTIEQVTLNDSKEIPFIAVSIRRYVLDMIEDLSKGNANAAKARLVELQNAARDLKEVASNSEVGITKGSKASMKAESVLRKAARQTRIKIKKDFSPKNISIDTLYSPQTLSDLRLAYLQDDLDKENKNLESLKSQPYSEANEKLIEMSEDTIEMISQEIEIIGNDIMRESFAKKMAAATNEIRRNVAYHNHKESYEEVKAEWDKLREELGGSIKDSGDSLKAQFRKLNGDVRKLETQNDNLLKKFESTVTEMEKVFDDCCDKLDELDSEKGPRKELIAAQLRPLQSNYNNLKFRVEKFKQYSVLITNQVTVCKRLKDELELKKEFSGIDMKSIESLKENVDQLGKMIDNGNELLDTSNDIMSTVLGKEIKNASLTDVNIDKVDLGDEFASLRKERKEVEG